MVEPFFKTIKSELIWPVTWQSRQQAENAVARYIDGFYNPVRRHSSLDYQSPIAFERTAKAVSQTLSTKAAQVQPCSVRERRSSRLRIAERATGGVWGTDTARTEHRRRVNQADGRKHQRSRAKL
jgi:hypothetical protein